MDVIGADMGRQIKEFKQLAQVDLSNRNVRIKLELNLGAVKIHAGPSCTCQCARVHWCVCSLFHPNRAKPGASHQCVY